MNNNEISILKENNSKKISLIEKSKLVSPNFRETEQNKINFVLKSTLS